jgi:hypothetical protein
VLGVEFAIDVVAEAAVLARAELLQLLDEPHGARLVADAAVGRFAFTHPLIRETAYRELGLARRRTLHTDVAEALERAYATYRQEGDNVAAGPASLSWDHEAEWTGG